MTSDARDDNFPATLVTPSLTPSFMSSKFALLMADEYDDDDDCLSVFRPKY